MCGIAGIIDPDSQARTTILDQVLSLISHRGEPECQKEIANFKELPLAMGTNRLAITSQRSQPQPIHSPSGKFSLVFNGEVFNYGIIADELCVRCTDDSPPSDTSVLAYALDRWGVLETTERLDWEGAYICADHEDNSVFLCRDHLGIKPLYYSESGERVVFGSEIKSLAGCTNESIAQVPPGSIVKFDTNSDGSFSASQTKAWWSIDTFREQWRKKPESEICVADHCFELLRNAVHSRVPKGKCALLLSGGVDSTLVATLAREVSSNLTAYVLHRPGSPDLPFARELCRKFDLSLVEVPAFTKEEISTRVTETVRILEAWEWHVVNHAVPMLPLVERIRSDGHKIVLSGEGADELFCGYENSVDETEVADILAMRITRLAGLHRTNCQRLDRMFMAATIESRVPFLDRKLVEFATGLGPEWLFRDGANKWIIRRFVERLVGPHFAWRKKLSLAKGVGYRYDRSGVFSEPTSAKIIPEIWSRANRFPIENQFIFEFLAAGYGGAEFLASRSN